MLEKTKGAIKNGQCRDTGNIRYTRHRTDKCQRKPKGKSRTDNPEKLATFGIQDTRRRQTEQKTQHNMY